MQQDSSPDARPEAAKIRITALNSTILFVLAYLVANGAYQLATVVVADQLHIPGVWHLSRIEFLIANKQWWYEAVLSVYGAGPLACLGLMLAATVAFWKWARLQRGLFKLFVLWVALHACNQLLGNVMAGTLTQSGFWFVPSYLFRMGHLPSVVLAILAGVLEIVMGYFAAIAFLQSHDSITLMRFENRGKLIWWNIFVPWLAGSAVLALLKWPDLTINERLTFVTLLLLLGPMALGCANELMEPIIEQPKKTQLALGLALLTAAALIGWRIVLGHGISFS
ncbi:hypothetical protein LJY25_00735 [Hymenobacter sp. BT175]|uniref:hypothetical protein n=1 Tax=Hymenobacter translucens TaxID=2886507 RepID=UPI001D0E8C48|nr:hypothetical protein [Hymenobacter translucens]MCC2544954.1 hypothetical protein [Hymenobacter translucens]